MATALNFAWDDAKPAKPRRGRIAALIAALALAAGLTACGPALTPTQVADSVAARALSEQVTQTVFGRELVGSFAIHATVERGDGSVRVCGVLTEPMSVDHESFMVDVNGLEAGPVYTGAVTNDACINA